MSVDQIEARVAHKDTSAEPILAIEGLSVTFMGGKRPVRAVDAVDLSLARGETVALLGESGSGKSVTLRTILRLNPRGTRTQGAIKIDGVDALALSGRALQRYRGGTVSMVFQEPMLALDPVYTLGRQIVETIMAHEPVSKNEAQARALSLFERVRIPSPRQRLNSYPHEMSGGMRQRAMIALALSCNPKVLLADEPTTALDATVQVQVLLLLRTLQRDLGLSMIFVTHDIGAAVEVADRIAVMYAGRIVEIGPVRDILRAPGHPYTRGLMSARGHGGTVGDGQPGRGQRLATIQGSPPDLTALPPGCAFAPRCALADGQCRANRPALVARKTAIGVHAACCFKPLAE